MVRDAPFDAARDDLDSFTDAVRLDVLEVGVAYRDDAGVDFVLRADVGRVPRGEIVGRDGGGTPWSFAVVDIR